MHLHIEHINNFRGEIHMKRELSIFVMLQEGHAASAHVGLVWDMVNVTFTYFLNGCFHPTKAKLKIAIQAKKP